MTTQVTKSAQKMPHPLVYWSKPLFILRGFQVPDSPQGLSEAASYADSVTAAPPGEEKLRHRKVSGVH